MTAEFPVRLTTTPQADAARESILSDPGFGRYFSDHMVSACWTVGSGWHEWQVRPLEPFAMHPGAAVLHYGQEVFEGLKAYRHADGTVWLFRPDRNARRLRRSARRLALPELDEQLFLDSVEALVRVDEKWVPGPDGERSLYLRPFMFATEAYLGVRPTESATYAVIACPAGAYFPAGVEGVTLWVSDTYARAAKGGTGAAKCGGNYAASLAAQTEARQHGCDQVLFLDGAGNGTLEESGTMNLFLVTADGQLVTPGLGTILEGVTRDSVLALAGEHGLAPVERPIGLDELRTGCRSGAVTEVFAAGTAAVVTPIVRFRGDGYEFSVGSGAPGKLSMALRNHILDIQYGRTPDTRGWLHRVL